MEPDQKAEPNKDDLPLRANVNEVLVKHYVLDLSVDFHRKVIGGSIVVFLEPVGGTVQVVAPKHPETEPQAEVQEPHGGEPRTVWSEASDDFTLILDCCDLVVFKVEEVDVGSVTDLGNLSEVEQQVLETIHRSSGLVQGLISVPSTRWRQQQDLYLHFSRTPAVQTEPLRFHMDQWSLQIRKKGVRCPHMFPRAVRVWYETRPTGGSVSWTQTQDGGLCVYTMGSPINNRALFPCQEPPASMSTWRSRVRAPSEHMVLMSGENQAVPVPDGIGFLQWDYYVTMPMPASTFTIAVGPWMEGRGERNLEMLPSGLLSTQSADEDERLCSSHGDCPCRFLNRTSVGQLVIPHRVFAPSCHLQRAESTVLLLLPQCLAAAHSILGVHPFSRLDVLIVPAGFSSLGMASPHIVFLSQSVLAGGPGLCGARLCHEIAHSWFGLAIGARDWTEEWISEGFATYLEDVFWVRVRQTQLDGAGADEAQEPLRALLRWRRLKDELENSEEELQILRPNKNTTGNVSESGASVVKHGLNPGKPFMQVHYLKGYFLLKFLDCKVGTEKFLKFLHAFVRRFHGRLVLSEDFLQMFLDSFPALRSEGLSLEVLYSDWLDTPQVPEWLVSGSAAWSQTPAVEGVRQEVVKWMRLSGGSGKGTKRKRAGPKVNFKELNPVELVLLLELLLEEAQLTASCLRLLQTNYNLCHQDAEVKHRWCELVVKHKYAPAYRDVEDFLIHDQAMGVYLYGELMLQEDGRQQALARRCFATIRHDMDQSARSVVEEMIL